MAIQPARKRLKRVVPFLESHELLYGVRAVERDAASGEVNSVLCMFCAAFGREDDPRAAERQRARTQRPKYWGGPNFRSDNYKSHMTLQHPTRWAQYEALPAESRQRYFEAVAVAPKKQVQRRSLVKGEVATNVTITTSQSSPTLQAPTADESADIETPVSAPVSPAATVSSPAPASTLGRESRLESVGLSAPVTAVQSPVTAAVESPVVVAESELQDQGEEHAALVFLFDRDVVDVALGDVLFRAEDWFDGEYGKMSVMFESTLDRRDAQDQDTSDGTAEYRAVVRSVEFFRRVLELVAVGLSLDQIATIWQSQWGESVCRGPRDVARMACVAVGANLQALARVLKRSWAFSVSLHGVDRRRPGESKPCEFLDVRLRVCCSGKIVAFHLLALPVAAGGDPDITGETFFHTTAIYLQALHKRWLHKIIGCSIEVIESAVSSTRSLMSVLALAFARKTEQQAISGLVRVSSARPPLDALLQRFFDSILLADGAEWQSQLVGLSAYLQRQMSIGQAEELIAASVTNSPSVLDMAWLKLADIARWFDNARVPIQRLLARRNASVTPPPTWWLHLKIMLVVSSMAIKTRAGLQGGYTTLLFQQPQLISMLRLALAGDVGVEGPLPEYQRTALREHNGHGDMIGSNDGVFAVKPHSIVAFVRGMGSWAAELFDELSAQERQKVIVSTVDRMLDLVQGLQGLAEQLDEQGGSNTTMLRSFPPVLPHQVVVLNSGDFQEIIRAHRSRLTEHFSAVQLAAIETQHRDLRTAAASKSAVRQLLDFSAEDPTPSFDEAWSALRGRWGLLADFCGGLATVFPSSNSDCSSSTAVSTSHAAAPGLKRVDFSLESRLQCQQFATLQALISKTDATTTAEWQT